MSDTDTGAEGPPRLLTDERERLGPDAAGVIVSVPDAASVPLQLPDAVQLVAVVGAPGDGGRFADGDGGRCERQRRRTGGVPEVAKRLTEFVADVPTAPVQVSV